MKLIKAAGFPRVYLAKQTNNKLIVKIKPNNHLRFQVYYFLRIYNKLIIVFPCKMCL